MRRHHLLLQLACRNPSFLCSNPPYTCSASSSHFTVSTPPPPSSEQVSAIVDDTSRLNLLEVADLNDLLRTRLGVAEMPMMAVLTPGMVPGSGGAAPQARTAKAAAEEKMVNTSFDLKLESFDAAAKIKLIMEVRTFRSLGLKEAKDLAEKALTLLKKGVM